MKRSIRALTIAAAGAALAAGLVSASPSGAHAATSCYPGYIETSGAKVSYTECNSGAASRVFGTVTDTDADGQCAWVRVEMVGSYDKSWKACPKGSKTDFDSGYQHGMDARVTLSER